MEHFKESEMGNNIVNCPYAPQKLVDGDVGGGENLSFKIDVPKDAVPSGVGSISIGSLGGANFNAFVALSDQPDQFDGPYASVDRTFGFQVDPQTPNKPGEQPKYPVAPGDTIYVNLTLEHDGKPGQVHTARCECRAAQ
jgi:hypothetical protein